MRTMSNRSTIKSFPSGAILIAGIVACFFAVPSFAQQDSKIEAVVVRPGAPGQPSRVLATDTRATLPPPSAKDMEFMQGMIMHHAQAVEMTDWIEERTPNKNIRLIGARIAKSQADEIEFMKRWLATRGEQVEMAMSGSHGSHGSHGSSHQMLMPGMLSKAQMSELQKARGAEFDRLFLTGMIQHHDGALVMVKDLFDTAGAGQDAELFNFATDVDNSQRAEIDIMRNLLGKTPVKQKS